MTVVLSDFAACESDDSAKPVLELVHTGGCGEVLCDIEPDDRLDVLVAMAAQHQCDVTCDVTCD